MDKALRNALIAGIILIGVSTTYYFVYRPLRIEITKKGCSTIALDRAIEKVRNLPESTNQSPGWHTIVPGTKPSQGYYESDYNSLYDKCLREKGL